MTTATYFRPDEDPFVVTAEGQGAAARRDGLDRDACPYDEGSILHSEWVAGYDAEGAKVL